MRPTRSQKPVSLPLNSKNAGFAIWAMIYIGSFALVVASLGCLPGGPGERTDPPPPEVTVAQPLVTPIVEWDPYTGRLAAIEEVDVRARVSGYLQSHHFEEGQVVEKGQLLFVIDPRPYEATLAQATADRAEAVAKYRQSEAGLRESEAKREQVAARLDLANTRLRRNRPLVPSGAISEDEFDEMESESLQAQADLYAGDAAIESARAAIKAAEAAIATSDAAIESADLDLGYCRIDSPITGRISRRLVTEGNLISGGLGSTVLTTIVSLDPIHAYFDANEQALMKYTRLAAAGRRESSRDSKNPVYLALIDEEGFPHLGHMDFVDNRVDRSTGSIRGRAIFPNPDDILTPGMFVKMRLPGSPRYDAVLVPDSAIGTDQASKFVYALDEDNTVRVQTVVLGPMAKGMRVIREGLSGQEKIIIRGVQRARPGGKVNPTLETLSPGEGDGLPDQYEPVPRGEWLGESPSPQPEPTSAGTAGREQPEL